MSWKASALAFSAARSIVTGASELFRLTSHAQACATKQVTLEQDALQPITPANAPGVWERTSRRVLELFGLYREI